MVFIGSIWDRLGGSGLLSPLVVDLLVPLPLYEFSAFFLHA